jgi:alpha-1,3-glucosyltransferase
MRATSLLSDLLIYIPSLYLFIRTWLGSRSSRAQHTALLTLLLQPALILIDSGHFQYNSVMLGFTALAVNFFYLGHDLLGAICFVLSLGFKQMALYYSPAIFAYLLGKCLLLGPTRGYVAQQPNGN